MCGRYTQTIADPEILTEAFDLEAPPSEGIVPRYNIAPLQNIATVVKSTDGGNRFAWMRWGLIPAWSKDATRASQMINARAETLVEKPSFRDAYRKRRCLVIADGFYEWKATPDGKKTPMYIRLKDGAPFGMAGLWENWKDPASGEMLTTCTIITTDPNELIKDLHHRMAVILPRDSYHFWLDSKVSDTDALQSLLLPYPADSMEAYAVSTRVNNTKFDAPDLIVPISPNNITQTPLL